MEIKELKINSFGNIKDKVVKLEKGINVIKGTNESGKSTLMKFIVASLYGLSKNKDGNDIPDFDKYKPWTGEVFEGKIKYVLDNGDVFEIYRDFNKKNSKIFNNKAEDITDQYSVSKNRGTNAFEEQTKVTEELLMKTAFISQNKVALSGNEQKLVLEKMSNLISTGDENLSFEKSMDKLIKKKRDEIGTAKTLGKPINILNKEKDKYTNMLHDINQVVGKRHEYEIHKKELANELAELENKNKLLISVNEIKKQIELEEEKNKINLNILKDTKHKIEELKKKENDLRKNETPKNSYIQLLTGIMAIALGISAGLVFDSIFIVAGLVVGLLLFFMQINKAKKIVNFYEKHNIELSAIKNEIQLHKEHLKQAAEKVEEVKNTIRESINQGKKNLSDLHGNIEGYFNLKTNELNKIIEQNREEVMSKKLEINTLEVHNNSIIEKMEELPKIQDELKRLKEEEQELKLYSDSIDISMEILEQAYNKMKDNIAPEFEKNLNKMVSKVSENKYNKLKLTDDQGLIAEIQNGDYKKAELLSVGTIDQMYLGLRLSTMIETIEENMPIILDEVFVYYDKDRLKAVLDFLHKTYTNQIILFTCSNRETETLDKMNIEYNLAELT